MVNSIHGNGNAPMDVKRVREEFLASRAALAPKTLVYYKQVLLDFELWLDGRDEFSPALYDAFIADLLDGWVRPGQTDAWYRKHANRSNNRSKHTITKYQRALRAFAHFAVDRGYLDYEVVFNPRNKSKLKILNPKPAPRTLLTGEDIQLLFTNSNTLSDDRDKLILALFLETGMRASEALSLEWKDVSEVALATEDLAEIAREHRLIHIRHGKGDKERRVPLMPITHRQLRLQPGEKLPNDRILRWDKRYKKNGKVNEPITYQGLYQILDALEDRTYRDAGREIRCNAHNLRRTFATMFIRNGGNAGQLQQLMGHANIATTMSYVHLVPGDMVEAVDQFGTFSAIDIE